MRWLGTKVRMRWSLLLYFLVLYVPQLYESKVPSWLQIPGGSTVNPIKPSETTIDDTIYDRTVNLRKLDDIIDELQRDISSSERRTEKVERDLNARVAITKAERDAITREREGLVAERAARRQLEQKLAQRRAEREARERRVREEGAREEAREVEELAALDRRTQQRADQLAEERRREENKRLARERKAAADAAAALEKAEKKAKEKAAREKAKADAEAERERKIAEEKLIKSQERALKEQVAKKRAKEEEEKAKQRKLIEEEAARNKTEKARLDAERKLRAKKIAAEDARKMNLKKEADAAARKLKAAMESQLQRTQREAEALTTQTRAYIMSDRVFRKSTSLTDEDDVNREIEKLRKEKEEALLLAITRGRILKSYEERLESIFSELTTLQRETSKKEKVLMAQQKANDIRLQESAEKIHQLGIELETKLVDIKSTKIREQELRQEIKETLRRAKDAESEVVKAQSMLRARDRIEREKGIVEKNKKDSLGVTAKSIGEEEKIHKLEIQLTRMQNRTSSLTEELNNVRAECDKALKERKAAELESATMKTAKELSESRFKELISQKESSLVSLKAEINGLRSQMEEISAKHAAEAEAKEAELQRQLSLTTSRIRDLESLSSKQDKGIKLLEQSVAQTSYQLEKAKNDLEASKEYKIASSREINNLEQIITEKSRKLSDLQKSRDNQYNKNERLGRVIDKLKEALTTKEIEIKSAKNDAEVQNKRRKDAIENLAAVERAHAVQISTLQNMVQARSVEAERVTFELAQVKSEMKC